MRRQALVVGGTGEIGGAIARHLVEAGVDTVVAGHKPAPPDALPASVSARLIDVRDRAAARRLVREVSNDGLDICVYAAGVAHEAALLDETDAGWDDLMAVNLAGAFAIGQEAGRAMASAKGGVLLFIASSDGYAPPIGYGVYAATKAALLSLSKSLATELAPFRVRVNALCPGHIDTELSRSSGSDSYQESVLQRTPMHRAGTVEEVAAAAVFLCSDNASFITGAALVVDGGRMERW